jgi:hypothetical protein
VERDGEGKVETVYGQSGIHEYRQCTLRASAGMLSGKQLGWEKCAKGRSSVAGWPTMGRLSAVFSTDGSGWRGACSEGVKRYIRLAEYAVVAALSSMIVVALVHAAGQVPAVLR